MTAANDNSSEHAKAAARQQIVVALGELKVDCANLRKVIDLDLSGVRDGHGVWQGSDPLDHYLVEVAENANRIRRLRLEPQPVSLGGRSSDDEIPF